MWKISATDIQITTKKELLINPEESRTITAIGESFKKSLGENITNKALEKYGELTERKLKSGQLKMIAKSGTLSTLGTIKSPSHKNFGE